VTVNFELDDISFTVSGVKHHDGFDIKSVHLQGNSANVRNILACDFIERLSEAAVEAAALDIPFASPQPLVHRPLLIDAEGSVTFAERCGYPKGLDGGAL
jgi:hypothetical protein